MTSPGPITSTGPTTPPPVSRTDGIDAVAVPHLLRRATYGSTPALLAEATALGPRAWLEQQLAPRLLDDAACDRAVARFPLAHATPPALHTALQYGAWDGMQDLVGMTFSRACWSRRQLFEVMVEFWSDHLNVTCPSSEVWSSRGVYDRDVVRKHALGRFGDMLAASCTSPAMLQYLDNLESRGSAPNENYGREVLELHSVGRDAGYGQAGVVDSARAFTGLTVWNPWNGGTAATNGLLRYRSDWHHVGPLEVLDWTHPNGTSTGGREVAESLVRHLARHPATAARIARKLAVRFVSDDPPASLVDRLARVYLANGTAIKPVLRALFGSPEFAASAGMKYRRPYEGAVAVVRALGITPSADGRTDGVRSLVWHLSELGHAPMGWHPPDGHPDVAAAWTGSGTLLGRWNLNVGLAQAWWRDGLVTPPLAEHLLPVATRPTTRAGLVEALHARLVPGGVLPVAHRDALVTFLGGAGPVRTDDVTWQFGILVALLLDSPHWSAR